MHSEFLFKYLVKKGLFTQTRFFAQKLKNYYKNGLRVNGDEVILIGDIGSMGRRVAPMMLGAHYLCSENLGLKPYVVLQDVKQRKASVDSLVKGAILQSKKNIVITCLSDKLGKLEIGKSFRKYMKYRECKFLTTPSLGGLKTNDISKLIKAIDIDYNKLSKDIYQLKNKLDLGKELRITTKLGTDVKFSIRGQYAIPQDGRYYNYREGGNLPAGEVYLAPVPGSGHGVVMIDGSVRHLNGTSIASTPVKVKVRNGSAWEINGGKESVLLNKSLQKASKTGASNARVVCEVGIGLNPNAIISGAMILDEKALGTAHIAFGSNVFFGGTNRSNIHLDQVFKKPHIYIDGVKVY